MKQKISGLIRCVIIGVFACMLANTVFAETVNYSYDDLNRLIKAEYGSGLVIEYSYDEAGNRIQHIIKDPNDTTPPTTTASPLGGTYNTAQTVTLTCADIDCNKIYYTTDGTTPTTSSSIYSWPITISTTTTLKYFSMDVVGNSEAVKSQSYLINAPTGSIRIARAPGVYYTSLQDAYNAAIDGDSIQVQAVNLTGKFSANRNISLSLQGGYSNDFTTISGNTILKGMIQTFSGGGTMTIRNFVLNK